MERAVIYARYSSTAQRGESIDQQVRVCRRYAQQHDIDIIDIYQDRAMTGTVDKRPGFQQMINDAKAGKWSYVIVYALDRFARDRYDSARYKHSLKQCGVRVLSATEAISDDPSGIIMESLLEGMAEYYSVELSRKVSRGLEDNASKCMSIGHPPYGYATSKDHKYVINDVEADIVREIYARTISGETPAMIAADFNKRAIRTQHGNVWKVSSFQRLLQNERYCGVYIYKDIRIDGGMPQIIARDDFDRVQQILYTKPRARADATGKVPQRRRRENSIYLLTGKLYCGECGEPMVGISGTGKSGALHYYYQCKSRRHGGGCHKSNVRRDYIEQVIAAALRERMLSDEAIAAIADAAMDAQQTSNMAAELANYRQALKEAENGLRNVMRAIEMGIITETTKARMEELEQAKKEAELGIKAAEADIADQPTREQIIALLEMYREGDIQDKDYQEALLDTFLAAAYVYDDHVDIVFTLDGHDVPHRAELGKDDIAADLDAVEAEAEVGEGSYNEELAHQQRDIRTLRIIVVCGLFAMRADLKRV